MTAANYILASGTDVLDAMMRDKRVDEATVEEYIEHVYAWESDDQIENERGERVDPDPLKMKVFEIEHLGRFDEKNYDGNEPDHAVEQFRTDKIITAHEPPRVAAPRRGVPCRRREPQGDSGHRHRPRELRLGRHPADLRGLRARAWDNPPSGTETARLKAKTLDNMVGRANTAASASAADTS